MAGAGCGVGTTGGGACLGTGGGEDDGSSDWRHGDDTGRKPQSKTNKSRFVRQSEKLS